MRRLLIFILLLNTIARFGYSQEIQETTSSGSPSYDLISVMLDSMVNQTYVQRISATYFSTEPGNKIPGVVPVFEDKVYANRIEKISSPIPLTYNQQVREYIDLYSVKKRDLTERVMGLSNLYFPMFEQILDQQDLPIEFKYLSIVESALIPTAVSPMGAAGLWQFMYGTGKMYNLKINSYIDERRDPVKSTYAACQYFKDMYKIYGDWLLVIAAYNCGPGNVNKAIARSGGKMNFWEISQYLPRETRGYVPAFVAVTYLMNYTQEHNLQAVPPVLSFHEADTVMVTQEIGLKEISETLNIPLDLLYYLNPVYKRGFIPEYSEPQALRLPANKVPVYLASLDKLFYNDPAGEGKPITEYITRTIKKYHVVRRGEHLYAIADRYNVSSTEIKRWNKLRSSKLYAGQKLLVIVPVREKILASSVTGKNIGQETQKKSDLESTSSPSKANASKPSMDEKFAWHVVQPGDTLWNIAQRYRGMTVNDIKEMNNLNSSQIKPGTKLKVKITGG